MTLRLNGATSGFVEIKAADVANDNSLVLPNGGNLVAATNGNIDVTSINDLNYPTAGALSNRNLIINGAMQVAQRGTSQTGVTSTTYAGPDRYRHIVSQGAFTISQSTTAPGGFSNSTKWDCTTAVTLTTTNAVLIQQRIEAQNLQHLKFGTSSAEELTLSFWVRSNLTGVLTVEAYIDDDFRQISREVTISSANTWEYKTVSIPGDTVGVIDNDSGPGMDITFWLDSGPGRKSGTLNTSGWASLVEANRVSSSNISFAASTDNEFYLTGVQLEVGTVATPFEHRSYGDELDRCERYFQTYGPFFGLISHNYAPTTAYCGFPLRKPMRHSPTAYHVEAFNSSHLNYYSNGGAAKTLSAFGLNQGQPNWVQFVISATSPNTLGNGGDAGHLDINQADAIQLQAEL